MIRATLVPGFNGSARQPLLVRLKAELKKVGITAQAITLKRARPKPGLQAEVDQLRRAADGSEVLIGRSFGGRVCTRLAVLAPPRALVVLGYPIRPPGLPRPLDEAALKALTCPTLILQGADDALGPPAVLRRLLAGRPNVTIEVIAGAGHTYGRHERAVIERAAQWLSQSLGR